VAKTYSDVRDRAQRLARAAERRNPGAVGLVEAWVKRFFEIQGIDRSIVLAAQAFTALFPLLIVYASIVPHASGLDFADTLIDRFDLDGAAAESVRQAFAPPDTVQSSVSIVSVIFVVVAALAFTRAFQRIYEEAWRLERRGARDSVWGLAWLGAMVVAYSIGPVITVSLGGLLDSAVTLTTAAGLWLLTPYLLLARRLPWRRLVPGALLTATIMTAVGVASAIFVPPSVTSSADQFGIIGVAFALLGWLVVIGFAVTIAATGGAVITEQIEAANDARSHAGRGSRRRMRR
jgi:membrane protein